MHDLLILIFFNLFSYFVFSTLRAHSTRISLIITNKMNVKHSNLSAATAFVFRSPSSLLTAVITSPAREAQQISAECDRIRQVLHILPPSLFYLQNTLANMIMLSATNSALSVQQITQIFSHK